MADEAGNAAGDRSLAAWAAAVREGYDDVAGEYDRQRDPPETAVRAVAAIVASLDDGDRLLDAGCGGGRLVLESLADEYETVGFDLSRTQLALARERAPESALVQGELTTTPIATDAVDAVTCLHALIHVPREHHRGVLAEFARVLRPGGHLLVTVAPDAWEGTNPNWLAAADDSAGPETTGDGASMRWSFYGAEHTRESLRDGGFTVEDSTLVGEDLDDGEWVFIRARLDD